MITDKLADLETTMPQMAAYLMIAGETHSKALLGKFNPAEAPARSRVKLRLTQQQITALRAYGLPRHAKEFRDLINWFDTPYEGGGIDEIEMHRLETLLLLEPASAGVAPRLHRLLEQRLNDHYFYLEEASENEIFDTLWVLKVLMMAREAKVLPSGLIADDEIASRLDYMINVTAKDKDQALALRLYYDLCGELKAEHLNRLEQLLSKPMQYGNMWGIDRQRDWRDMEPLVAALHRRQLRPGLVNGKEKKLLDLIVNTCYVIENLCGMACDYPQITPPVEHAMRLWWDQIRGDDALNLLKSLFRENEYNLLLALCRTVVTVCTYVNEPLGSRFWLVALRDMSEKLREPVNPDLNNIRHAIQRWIDVQIDEVIDLKLGLSDAKVARVRTTVIEPISGNPLVQFPRSLVVKYGPLEEIRLERRNYTYIPPALRRHFVNIPKETYRTRKRRAYVIMQDLVDYETFFERYSDLLMNTHVEQLLTDFLAGIHNDPHALGGKATANHLRELYLLPMLRHMEFIAAQMNRVKLGKNTQRFRQIESELSKLLARVLTRQNQFKGFQLTLMHGDLHTRNLMIRRTYPDGNSRPRINDAHLDFRLIDLASLRSDGDSAHDIGQLLADLQIILADTNTDTRPSGKVKKLLESLQRRLYDRYAEMAQRNNDRSFVARLELAQARAYIRVAKGRARRSGEVQIAGDDRQIDEAIDDILTLSELAIDHLNQALTTRTRP